MKKSIFIFIGIIIGNAAIAQYDPKALEILEAMGKKYKAIPSFEVNFSQALTNESAGVKDEIKATSGKEKYESTILGAGIVNTKEVIDTGKSNGTIHFIIEQESYQGKDSVASCKEDYDIMKKWGY